ncbi:MAG: UDP-N-acetylmuramate--L-alanine ligase [Bacteroidetes bacterium]|nr:UDP-N-acetylmuramate--L-alanine ligase [Bacteroidota bacterium]
METRWKQFEVMYFLGVGGIGMSALARYFHQRGVHVLGYDKTPTALTTELELEGIVITYDDSVLSIPELLHVTPKEKVLIVRTPAVPSTSNQWNYFIEKEYLIWKRSELLGYITEFDRTIAIGGTHGKTTTSSIVAHLLHHSVGCNAFLGGIANNFKSNVVLSQSDITVVEADEFDRSFLTLSPTITVLTSLDADHLDIYGHADSVREGFLLFLGKTKSTGHVVVKKELQIENEIQTEAKVWTYSAKENADFYASDIRIFNGKFNFNLHTPFGHLIGLNSGLPGRHNVENAVAAIAATLLSGMKLESVAELVESYTGVLRRFDMRYKSEETVYIDDYAHHPTELNAAIQAARELNPNRKITVIFQPHLFSRTRDFADEFADSLAQADELILLPIYPARELPIPGIDSQWLFDKIKLEDKKLVDKDAIFTYLNRESLQVLMTLGAGDIDTLVTPISNWLESEK